MMMMMMAQKHQQQQRTYNKLPLQWLLLLAFFFYFYYFNACMLSKVVHGAPPSPAPPQAPPPASAMRLDFCAEKSKHLSKFFTINELICWNTNNLNYYEYFRMFNITNGHLSNEYQVSKLFGRFDDLMNQEQQTKSNEIEGVVSNDGGDGGDDDGEREELKILWAFTFDVIKQNCLRVKPQPLMHYCKRIEQLANTIIVRLSNMELLFMQLHNGHFIRQPEDGGQYFLEFRALVKHLDRFMPISSITFDETRDIYVSTHYGQFNQICVTRALWYGKVLVNNQTRLMAVKVPLPELSQLLQRDLFDTRCVFTKQQYSSVIDFKQMIYGTRARRDSATGRIDHLQLMIGDPIEFKWLNTETDQAFFNCYGNSSIVKLRTSNIGQQSRQFWPSAFLRQNGHKKGKGFKMFRNLDDDDDDGDGRNLRYYTSQRYFWFHVVLWVFIATLVLMLLLNFCSLKKSRLNLWNWTQGSMGKPPFGKGRKGPSGPKKPSTTKRGGAKRGGGGKDSKDRRSGSRKKSRSGRSGRKPPSRGGGGGGPMKKSKTGKLPPAQPKRDRSKSKGGGFKKLSEIGSKFQWFLQDRMLGLGFGGDDDHDEQRRPGGRFLNLQPSLKKKTANASKKLKQKTTKAENLSTTFDSDSTLEEGFSTFERSDRITSTSSATSSGSDSGSGFRSSDTIRSFVSSQSTIGLSPGDSGFIDYDDWAISPDPSVRVRKPERKIRPRDSLVLMMRKKLEQEQRLQTVKKENNTSTSVLLDESDKSSVMQSECILKQMEDESKKKKAESKLSLTNRMAEEEHGDKLKRIIDLMRQMNEQFSLSPGGQQPTTSPEQKPQSTDSAFEMKKKKKKEEQQQEKREEQQQPISPMFIEEVEVELEEASFIMMDDDADDVEATDQGGHRTSSWHSAKPPISCGSSTASSSCSCSALPAGAPPQAATLAIDMGTSVETVTATAAAAAAATGGLLGGGGARILSFPYRPHL